VAERRQTGIFALFGVSYAAAKRPNLGISSFWAVNGRSLFVFQLFEGALDLFVAEVKRQNRVIAVFVGAAMRLERFSAFGAAMRLGIFVSCAAVTGLENPSVSWAASYRNHLIFSFSEAMRQSLFGCDAVGMHPN
jgi:hypothetical protein